MASVFLSYAREDRRSAEALSRVLAQAGHEVWSDDRIESGQEFNTAIEAALDSADVILVAWSKHSTKSPWVRDEATTGRDTGRLLPTTIDGSLPPMGFRQFQTLDLSGWKGEPRDRRTAELLGSVERRLKSKGKATPSGEQPAKLHRAPFDWIKNKQRWTAAAAVLLLACAAAAFLLIRTSHVSAEPASLAVLPFKNMSAGDPYFAEGVAEEISDQLAREPQFSVAGRTSAALFKDAADLVDVGRRLHVAYVLEGSVRSAGKQVRVNVALVDTHRGMQLWSQDFNGSLDDVFAIQDSIGREVTAHVRSQLVREVRPAAMKTSGEVHSLTATARSLMHQREPGKIGAAVDLLKHAVKLDPNYAPAWAQLALALQLDSFYGHPNEPSYGSSAEQRLALAEHAIKLAPQLAEAHAVTGLLLSGNRDMDAAKMRRGEEELEEAVRLNPSDAESWYWLYSVRLESLDFQGALDALRRSGRIDPFFGLIGEHLPRIAWDMGYRDEAIEFLNERIAHHPDPFIREIALSVRASLQNDPSTAYQYAAKARDIGVPDDRSVAELRMGSILLRLGLLDEAERFVPRRLVDLRRGKLTFKNRLRDVFPRALDFWYVMDAEPHLLPRLLVKLGRSADLVSLYDETFSSPENMALRYSNRAFVEMAPMLAIALHRSDRREGARVLLLADKMCRRGFQEDHSPQTFRVSCSRLWAVLGHKELAIGTVEKAAREGWRPDDGEYPLLSDEPAFALIRDDPRIRRIDATLGSERARERHELLAAGV